LLWYFLASDGQQTFGAGVETGAGALCHWSVDGGGVSLHLDVRCGSAGVQLGARTLQVATVRGVRGEAPFATARQLCRTLCANPRLPREPVYGGNDWYYVYGHNSRASILRDAATLNELAPDGANRPFLVIDDGWQERSPPSNGGPWNPNAQFGEMAEVALAMKARGVRPGLWFRPLLSSRDVPASWRFQMRDQKPLEGNAPAGLPLDPSVPEVLQLVGDDLRRFGEWGFELVKHDFSTYDIFWKWGFEWTNPRFDAADVTVTDWSFADKTRTSAEIIGALYGAMRAAAGDEMLLLGCNTIGHLGAGHFEIQRTGDDTSGREWERTRKMGINTLAFRQPQHDAFFAVDADCVGLTPQIPWELNRQWLDLLSRSGTPLFVSADPEALGAGIETDFLKRIYKLSGGRPMMLSEWHYGATNQGLSGGARQVKDQRERGLGYRNYVEGAAALGFVVGQQWFSYLDQAVTGRWFEGDNGERGNIGLVNVADRPYKDFLAEVARTNDGIYDVYLGRKPPFHYDDPRFSDQVGAGKVVLVPCALPGMTIDGVMNNWPGLPAERISHLVLGTPPKNASASLGKYSGRGSHQPTT